MQTEEIKTKADERSLKGLALAGCYKALVRTPTFVMALVLLYCVKNEML